MVFFQIKNTFRYGNITRCNRKLCECFEYIVKDKSENDVCLHLQQYRTYIRCYRENTKPEKDPFLL